jgi:hypothetical protein
VASLYTAYFDESGTHDSSEAAVVAGFVSNKIQWSAFSDRWQQVLENAHLDYFRMSDFENRRGQFIEWSENKRRNVLNELLSIINDHTFYSIGCVVLKKSMESLESDLVKEVCGDAYGVAALVCWRNLGQVLQKLDGWLDCSMETGAKGSSTLQLLFEEDSKIPEWQQEHRIIKLSFRDKRLFLPLQAADILAYELYKQSMRQFGDETRLTRYPLKMLSGKKGKWVYMTDELLRQAHDDLVKQLARFYPS